MRAKEIIERLNTGAHTSLLESILIPEVDLAFRDWVKHSPGDWILIGGNVVGYYTRPRTTIDIDVLFRDKIPEQVVGFKKTRGHAFQHNKTHVEVETLTPDFINLSDELAKRIFSTAIKINGVWLPSPAGLIALKMQRLNLQDFADIHAVAKNQSVDLTGWPIDDSLIANVEDKIGIKLR